MGGIKAALLVISPGYSDAKLHTIHINLKKVHDLNFFILYLV